MSICICWFHFHIESAEYMVTDDLKMIFTGCITKEMCLYRPRKAEFENQHTTQVLEPELTSSLVLSYPQC
jgi:hypothetical protein